MPQSGPGGGYVANKISLSDAITYAKQAGFSGDSLVNIVSIALAESGLDANAQNCNNAGGSCDRGIVQINNYWHSEVNDTCAYDPRCAFKAAYSISNNGTSFTPWTTFTSGASSKFTNAVQAALGLNTGGQFSNNTSTNTGDPCSAYANCGVLDFGCQFGGDLCKLLHSSWFEQAAFVLVGLLVALVAITMIGLNAAKEGS
jgi:hypothetical protein